MSAAIMGVLKYLPASLARKALTKVNPGFENYFSKALSYGIDADRAIDYLTDRFTSDSQKEHERHLYMGAQNNTLRPDEKVSRSEMSNSAIPGKLLKGAASLAIGGSLGTLGKQTPPESPQKKLQSKQKALEGFKNNVKKRKESELAQKQLMEQFDQAYGQQPQGQGKQQLLQSMKEITDYLEQMKGRNG